MMTISEYANTYDVSEYQVFLHAFRWWYNREATRLDVQEDFHRYMAAAFVPTYVRLYLGCKLNGVPVLSA